MIRFTVIITTHNRPHELARAVLSIQKNTYKAHQIIVIQDSPDADYSYFFEHVDMKTFTYVRQPNNRGSNASKNHALTLVTPETDYIIFLDDDDFFHPDALLHMANTIETYRKKGETMRWLVTNRSLKTTHGYESLTHNKTKYTKIQYFFSYVLTKRFYGDATHCISFDFIQKKKAHFPYHVKNGEEIYFFLSLGGVFFYKPYHSTITFGYGAGGLSDMLKGRYTKHTRLLWKEEKNLSFTIYLVLRTIYGSVHSLLRSK